MLIRRKAREQRRHGRAVVRQERGAMVDPTSPETIARNKAAADKIRRDALKDN
jgi:hypothetical protein